MNSARLSVGGNKHAGDKAVAESEDESSSSSSSSELSSSESSSANSDRENEATEADAVKKLSEQPSVKSKSSVLSSASKSNEQKLKKISNMTEEAGDKESKPPFLETLSKNSSTVANPKSDELPSLSVKKFVIKKPTEKVEEIKAESPKEGSEKVKTKSEELSNLSVKLSTAKKLAEVERDSSNELSEKSSKFSRKSKKTDKDLSVGEMVKDDAKEKDLKETPETPSKDSSDKNSKGTPGKVSKLSSGWLKKFENPTENNDGKDVIKKNSSEKLPGVRLRKTSAGTKGEETKETKEDKSPDAVVSCSEKALMAERASNEQPADSGKTFKVPKLKKSSDKNPADNKESSGDSSADIAKSSCDVKEKISTETTVTDHDKANITTEKIAKESLTSPAKDVSEGTRDAIGLTPEITSSKEAKKKRKKSPVNDVRETEDKEEEKDGDEFAVVYRKKCSPEDRTLKLTVDNDDKDAPAKTKRGKSPKSPSAAVDGIISINVEVPCTDPIKVQPTEFVEEINTVTGEAVAKEIERKEHGKVVDVDEKVIASEKTIYVAIKALIDERDTSIKDAKSEVLAKTTIRKTSDVPDIAAHRTTDDKLGDEDLASAVTEDAGDETTKEREGGGGEEGEVPVLNRSESVDDFIQKILSEVRGPDWRLKEESEQELQETRLEPTDGEPRRETKAKAKAEENETETKREPPLTNKSVESRLPNDNETKQRSTKLPVDEGEKQAVIAKYLRKKERQSKTDSEDLDTPKRTPDTRRTINGDEMLRLGKLNQNHDFESNHAPYATTMAGPKVSKGKLKRFNFGDGQFREKGEEISKFRQERLPEEAFWPRRSEGTSAVVRQKSRGVRTLVENQSEVIDAVKRASSGLEELDQELDSIKQLSLGYRRRVEELERAFDAETKAYETEYRTAAENCRQRSVQPKIQKKKKRENFLDLMFGTTTPAVPIDAEFDALSAPAVASFLKRYGSGETANKGPLAIGGVVDQPLLQDFGSETVTKFSSKIDEYLFAPERRNEIDDRMENGREFEPTASISRLIPSFSDTRIEISSLDEFLNRVESKYSTLSPASSLPAEPARSLKLAEIVTTTTSFPVYPPDAQRPSRQQTRAANSGYFAGGSLTPDRVLPWTEKGTGPRSVHFGDELGGHLNGNARSGRSKGGTESYTIRSVSIGPRSRRK